MSAALAGRRVLMLLDNACAPDWRVLREAAALRDAGAAVRILCWDREARAPETETRDGLLIERIRTPAERQRGIRQLGTLARFYREASRRSRESRADVVHAHDLLMLPLGAFLARRLRAPLIYDAHEIYHVMEAERYPRPLLAALAGTERWLVRHSVDALVTVSQQRVAAYWDAVRGRTPVFVVGNWYDPVTVSREARARARAELGITDDTPVLLYAGGIAAERRLDLLIEAAAERPGWMFVVAGRGELPLERRLQAAGQNSGNLRVTGWQDQPAGLYAAADALYYVLEPSHPYTRFAASNTLHLAIAYGLPLITAPLGEPGRIMRGVADALVLEPPSAGALAGALDLLRDETRRRNIGAAMRALQGTFGWAQASRALLAAYGAVRSGMRP